MPDDFWVILGVAAAAALASPLGGLLAIWRRPTSLFMSLALGFASGVLIGTITLEMVPKSLELGSLPIAIGGFAFGFAAVYGFDLFIHRGVMAGDKAEQRHQVRRFHEKHRPRGSAVTVLAGGTSAEELIEGISIGVGTAIAPGAGLLVGLAIVIDNISEGLAIGELIREENHKDGKGRSPARRILGWTGLIGVAVLVSSLAGWFLLRGLPPPVLGFLFGMGGGGMFYLTVTDLLPESEQRHYQQLGGIAVGTGFLLILVLSILT